MWRGTVLEVGTYTVSCKFEAILQDFSCYITGVYAPNCGTKRRLICDEISAVRGLMEGAWAIYGDFNIVRYPTEKGTVDEEPGICWNSLTS